MPAPEHGVTSFKVTLHDAEFQAFPSRNLLDTWASAKFSEATVATSESYPEQSLTGRMIFPKALNILVRECAKTRHVHVVLNVQEFDAGSQRIG